MRGDSAFKAGEKHERMYFLDTGCVQSLNKDETIVLRTYFGGSYFGELGMLTRKAEGTTATAAADSILFCVTSSEFDDIIANFADLFDRILEKATQRLDGAFSFLSLRKPFADTESMAK
eukprot:463475-Prymnesium_polylepis.1